MTQKFNQIFEINQGEETLYRVSPNPDATPNEGFKHGAVISFSDLPDRWVGHFFIGPKSLEAMGEALIEAAKDVKK